MNEERNRFQTFTNWPADAPVSSQRIAKAGFFSTGQGLEVECFSCHLKINSWEYGDQVMSRHRNLSPQCPFILQNPIAMNHQMTRLVPSSSLLDYRDESVRLASFEGWPITHIVSPENLARAGFYYLKDGDHTKCGFCKGVVRAWEVGDDPDVEHKRHFPSCSFVINKISPRLNTNETNLTNNIHNKAPYSYINLKGTAVDGNLDELGVQKHNGPKRPEYATVEARLRSFVAWSPSMIQTPDILSNAGFYYEGMGDQVRCFHCDGGLRHWDPEDDPWTEHARWFPRCSFVKLVKGQEFVAACALDATTRDQQGCQQNGKIIRRKREVSERELQEHMISAAALAALGIGINVERVKRAIKEKLQSTGRGYSQADALVEAALNVQLEEDDNFDAESTQNIHIRNTVSSVIRNISNNVEPQSQTQESSIDNNLPQVNETTSNSNIATNLDHSTNLNQLNKSISLEEENRQLKEARQCKICMDNEVGIVFLPCGHLTTCVNCAPNLEDCPMCRCAIKATVRTFLS